MSNALYRLRGVCLTAALLLVPSVTLGQAPKSAARRLRSSDAQGLHFLEQPQRLDRLGKKRVEPRFQRLALRFGRHIRRKHGDRQPLAPLAQESDRLQRFHASHAGHISIE